MTFLKKWFPEIFAALLLACIFSFPMLIAKQDAIAASLTLSNKKKSAYGNTWVIVGTATVSNGDTLKTGLSNVFYANVSPGAAATSATITTINSNDGTMGSSNGSLYIEYNGADNTATGNFFIIGR